jgi:hypothetical protein
MNETSVIADALLKLARGDRHDLASLLQDVEVHAKIDETRVTFHCHCLRVDGNGRPRVADLVSAVAEHVLDFAIPRSEIEAAKKALETNGSTAPLVRLTEKARGLFTDLTTSGEGGELLLFVLAEAVLRLPQILCKMDLKTNTRMHIHGADGLHAGVDVDSGHLLLYWGESKLHQDPTDAIRECLSSLGPMLKSSGESGAARRDMQLLSRYADLSDESLTEALKRFLDPKHEHFNQLEFCGLCLVGFDTEAYPIPGVIGNQQQIFQTISAELPKWKLAFKRRVGAEELLSFGFHVMSIPFPSVEDFRSKMLQQLGLAHAN